MAKRTAILHVGLPHSGSDLVRAALEHHAATLAMLGVRLPARSEEEMFRAAVEIRRDHRAWGLRRKDVEGVWSGICRRARSGGDTVVLGHDLLAAATPAEIALLVDGLDGFAVHVVVTAGRADSRAGLFPGDHDLGDVLDRWSGAVRSADRVHLLVAEPDRPEALWHAFGDVAGFAAPALPLDGVATTPRADVGTLRLLAAAGGGLASYDDLVALAEGWAKQAADEGYDVRGDTAHLLPLRDPAGPVPGSVEDQLATVSEALTDTLAELARLRERAVDLESRNAALARKRRRLKHRLADAVRA